MDGREPEASDTTGDRGTYSGQPPVEYEYSKKRDKAQCRTHYASYLPAPGLTNRYWKQISPSGTESKPKALVGISNKTTAQEVREVMTRCP